MTSATPNQREIIRPAGDTGMGGQSMAATPMEPQYSGSVSRGSLPAPTGPGASPASQQTAGIPLAPASDPTTYTAPSQPAPAQAPAPVASASGGRVTVQPGDTVYAIARRHGVSANSILQANGMSMTDNLRSGSTIIVPGASGSVTQVAAKSEPKGQGTLGTLPQAQANLVPPKAAPAAPKAPAATAKTPAPAAAETKPAEVAAYTPPKKTESVIQQSDEAAPNATGIGRMRWPVQGRVISQFGRGGGKTSDGIDISVPEGTPVKAAENGVVIYAGDGLKEFGNTVLVRHEDGLVTVYGHANTLKVSRGDQVKRGQEIAVSGMSGQTDVPKLHFEVRKNSSPVDPSSYLE